MNRRTAAISACLILLSLACNLQTAAQSTAVPASPAASPAASPTTGAPTGTPTESPLPGPTPTETRPFPFTIAEQTRYEGEKTYTCDAGGCWRDDGEIASGLDYFYPALNGNNDEIRALLNSIGLPADAAPSDAERWRRIAAVWKWMSRKAVIIGEPAAEEPWNYLQELTDHSEHWPSIGEMAKVFARFNVLPLGACNSKALTLATLLYRVGVLPDSIAVAHTKAFEGTNHLYLAVHMNGRWRYVDPSCIREHSALAPQPESVGCIGADYQHPYELIPLPGSRLVKPMLLE